MEMEFTIHWLEDGERQKVAGGRLSWPCLWLLQDRPMRIRGYKNEGGEVRALLEMGWCRPRWRDSSLMVLLVYNMPWISLKVPSRASVAGQGKGQGSGNE